MMNLKSLFTCGIALMAIWVVIPGLAWGSVQNPTLPSQNIKGGSSGLPQPPSLQAFFADPTNSSPIVLSNDKAWVWAVNPDDNSVSVISSLTDTEVFRLGVGREPRSIALDPNGEFAYVANTADNSVTVVQITGISPFSAIVARTIMTGAEPRDLVISPDGRRVYIANSGQDTITVLRADVVLPALPEVIGNVDLRGSACNVGDANRHFQPRGLAITSDNTKLYLTRFLSFTKPGSVQATNNGKEGILCRLDINTGAATILDSVLAFTPISLAAQDSGFPVGNSEQAYPNQMQSVVLRGNRAYLPNIAAAPAVPLHFDSDTHAFVNNVIGVTGLTQTDGGALNLHLGAVVPEAGKTKLFFANPWAMAFSNQSGAGNAYVVLAGSDLVVKLNVDAAGSLAFSNSNPPNQVNTTRNIDLNDPANSTTSGRNAGKNPLGLIIRNISPGNNKAYVMNYVSRNVSIINLDTDVVSRVINLTDLPVPGTSDEQIQVGKELFFSSRGNFDRPAGTTVSTQNRLSSQGWQSCASCHFSGRTDGNIWVFETGPRKSVPLNGTFNPHNPNDQRLLNYSATLDEIEDLELYIRNISGPGPLLVPINGNINDPNHGLLIGDTGDINTAPAVINALTKPNAGRPQHSVTLPGSTASWPALDALREWIRLGLRTPNRLLTTTELVAGGGSPIGGLNPLDVESGRQLFQRAGCQACHGGAKWTSSRKTFDSPPAVSEIFTENPPILNAVSTFYLNSFLRDIGSFNLGVAEGGNPLGPNIGAPEIAADGKGGLGKDYNGDGAGAGFNIPSLLGIWNLPPYYHNGACETLMCVLSDVNHRTANGGRPDLLSDPADQAKVVAFLQSIDANTEPVLNLLFLPIVIRSL